MELCCQRGVFPFATGVFAMTKPQKNNTPTLDEEVEETFPASDPPSYMGSTAIAGAPKEHVGSDGGKAGRVEKERVDIDLNEATEEELGAMPALGPKLVRTLLDNRPFGSWEELKSLPGFDGETIAALKKGGAHING